MHVSATLKFVLAVSLFSLVSYIGVSSQAHSTSPNVPKSALKELILTQSCFAARSFSGFGIHYTSVIALDSCTVDVILGHHCRNVSLLSTRVSVDVL